LAYSTSYYEMEMIRWFDKLKSVFAYFELFRMLLPCCSYILRMKEYERERRLMERAKKKKQMAASQSSEILVE